MTLSAILILSAAAAAPGYQGVLLDFTAEWCGPCRQVKPIVDRLERQGLPIRSVDLDRNRALAKRFGVNAVPTFVLVVNGKEVQRYTGPISESTMRRLISRIPTSIAAKDEAPESLYAAPKRESTGAKLKRYLLPLSKPNDAVAGRKPAPTVIRANNDSAGARPAGRVPNDPMVASVRIRVRDSQGVNYGSGTVIDSRAGRSLVLTCGHIFRGVPKDAAVEVDRFEGNKAISYTARVIAYDLKADVGLISIDTEEPVPTARIASPDDAPQRGDTLVGIGCGGGSRPLKIAVRVTGVNVYLGPGNLECTGMPQQGRSGGGLFDQAGRLVGVCFAAEPKNKRGLYASLRPIYGLLKYAKVQIRDSKAESQDTRTADAASPDSPKDRGMSSQFAVADGGFEDAATSQGSPKNPGMSTHDPGMSQNEEVQIDRRQLALMQVPSRGGNRSPQTAGNEKSSPFPPVHSDVASPNDKSVLNRVDDVFGKAGNAEVVCVIRRLDDPRAPSKVIIINRASAKFVRYLQNETRLQPRKTAKFVKQTSHESLNPREELSTPFQTVGGDSTGIERGRYQRSRATR